MNSVLDPRRSAQRLKQLLRPTYVWQIAEFAVVGICTLTFVLTAAGICASLLGKNSPGYLTRSRGLLAVLALASAAIQIGIFQGGTKLLHSPFYLLAAPAWLAWYLCATRMRNRLPVFETLEAAS